MAFGTAEIIVIVGVVVLVFGGASFAPKIMNKFREGTGAWKSELKKDKQD